MWHPGSEPAPSPEAGGPSASAAAAAAEAALGASGSAMAKEDLANLLMAWYHAGYYTGKFAQHLPA